jgi:acyl-CoA thioesterase FadM
MQIVEHAFRVMTYDIDFAGIVSNTLAPARTPSWRSVPGSAGVTYIRWLDGWSHLRNLYAERFLSLGEAFQWGIAPALMRTEIDYLAPVRFPATLGGRMWLAEHGRVKFVLVAEFESAAPVRGQVVARARQTGPFVALDTLRPVRLPEEYCT